MKNYIIQQEQCTWKNYYRVMEAEFAFKSLKRKMLFKRFWTLINPKTNAAAYDAISAKSIRKSSISEVSISAIKGMITNEGIVLPMPIPHRRMLPFWIKMWLIEDIDSIPEIRVYKTDLGWYLTDDVKSHIIYLMLWQRGSISCKIQKIEFNKQPTCSTHDLENKKYKGNLASVG